MLVSKLHYHKKSKLLDIQFDNGDTASLSAEFLRVHSPSAEVRGHGQAEPNLVTNKQDVAINQLKPVGHYAIQITFDDGHQSGLYSFDYLAHLCEQHTTLWQTYLQRLKQANAQRNARIAIKVI